MNEVSGQAQSLTDIIARVEQLALAREKETQAMQTSSSSPAEQVSIPLALSVLALPTAPDYILNCRRLDFWKVGHITRALAAPITLSPTILGKNSLRISKPRRYGVN
jgi:hypothetical protein